MLIVGITGTLGAGKGTIVGYLTERLHFRHYSVRDFVKQEIMSRGLPVNRDNMVRVANDLRAAHSPSFIVDELYKQASLSGDEAVIESIRTPGEVESLRKKGPFWLFAVDADAGLRYQRIVARNSETDNISFETFLKNEQREYTSDDPNKQNLKKCMEMADFRFTNNGTIGELHLQVQRVIDHIIAL